MASAGRRDTIEPLTKRNTAGEIYVRLPAVEAQIQTALGLNNSELIKRSRLTDRASAEHLSEECLAYLIREAFLRDDLERLTTVTRILMRRCIPWVRRGLHALGVAAEALEEMAEELVDTLIAELISEDGQGDFFQVRFRAALKGDILNAFGRYERSATRAQQHVSLSEPIFSAVDTVDGLDVELQEIVRSGDDLAESVESRLLIAAALESISDPRHRQAWALHHLDEWQIEARDPTDPSLDQLFGVSARTINNWLRQATAQVAAWYKRTHT
jgi:hypothetical protein